HILSRTPPTPRHPSGKRHFYRDACGITHLSSGAVKHRSSSNGILKRSLISQTSPLCALQELACKTFKGLELGVLQAAEGKDCFMGNPKKRRKSRTAFTNHQIYELEKRFLYQKYLSPVDRDQIAQQLGLTNAQVITWFQNRRAKLKRDLEEMKADVESAKAIGAVPLEKIARLADLERCARGTMGPSGPECPAHIYID
uniref:Ladybird homeobox 1b n=1 Tax=Electrophorus electricus TaxID=8005 RepID=A0A4W4FW47_ELEEL